MGLFKKKHLEPSPKERKREELRYNLCNARDLLEARVIHIYVLSQALQVYPESADKKSAELELEAERKKLLNYIADYDIANQEYNKLNKELGYSWVQHPSSHTVINNSIRRFIEK